MYGNTNLSTLFGALGTPPADLEAARSYGRALAKAGLPVLLVNPDSKVPADWRSTAEVKKDTAADRRGGVHLATTDTRTLDKYLKRAYAETAKRGHPAPLAAGTPTNWAVRLRGSGYIVADADTPEEVAALRAFLAQDGLGDLAPTVVTPGTSDGAHSGGGHWWFRLPEDLAEALTPALGLPATVKVHAPGREDGAGFSLYMGDAYVLVPPSVRDGRGYTLTAPDVPLPSALEDVIRGRLDVAESRRIAREEREAELEARGDVPASSLTMDEQITEWARRTPWTEILSGDRLTPDQRWTDTGVPDGCGCRVWTAPGPHGSRKSATTHSDVCTLGNYSLHNAPMHIWTDNPGPELERAMADHSTRTLSKLRVVAYLYHDGDESAALAEAGVETAQGTPLDMAVATAGAGTVQDAMALAGSSPSGKVSEDVTLPEPAALPVPEGETHPYDAVVDATEPVPTNIYGAPLYESLGVKRPEAGDAAFRAYRVGPASVFSDLEPPKWLVADMLEHGLCSIVGDSGVGKSAVVLDMLCHMAMGWPWRGKETRQCSTLYLAGESIHGALDRLKTWARVHEAPEVLDRVWVMQGTPQVSGDAVYLAKVEETVLRAGLEVIVVDTLARATVGLEENAAKDMGTVNGVFDRLMRDTGASLWYVHHVTRGTQHGRGSTALYGAVDSEVLITDLAPDGDLWDQNNGKAVAYSRDGEPVTLEGKPLTVQVNKQKNGADTGDDTWVTVLLGSVDSPDDTRSHAVVTELDGTPSRGRQVIEEHGHSFSVPDLPALTARRTSAAKPTTDAEQYTGPAVDRDQDVVERLADMVEAVVDAAPSQDARYTMGDLKRMRGLEEYRRDLVAQGWEYDWTEHVQAGMDTAVARRTNDVGRPTRATIGFVDRYDQE